MKRLSIILILIVLSTEFPAQSRMSLGVVAIPTFSTFSTGENTDYYEYISTFNYGLRTTFTKEKFAFSTGLLHLTQGTKFEAQGSSELYPESIEYYFDMFIKTKTLTIPLNIDYVFNPAKKTEFFGGLGVYIGYMYSQQTENTSIPKNYEPDSTIIYRYPPQRYTDVSIFNEFYVAINVGLGLRQNFNKRLNLVVRPNFLYQLRQKLPEDQNAWTSRLMSFSLDVGLFYNFGKGTKKEEKDSAPPQP